MLRRFFLFLKIFLFILVKVCGNGHLLVELGGLGQEGGPLEVGHLEHVGPALAGSADDLGGVDLDKPLFSQDLPARMHRVQGGGGFVPEN